MRGWTLRFFWEGERIQIQLPACRNIWSRSSSSASDPYFQSIISSIQLWNVRLVIYFLWKANKDCTGSSNNCHPYTLSSKLTYKNGKKILHCESTLVPCSAWFGDERWKTRGGNSTYKMNSEAICFRGGEEKWVARLTRGCRPLSS